jgi:phytoene dehydrogenase-like protein
MTATLRSNGTVSTTPSAARHADVAIGGDQSQERVDVVVVGGGLAGLAAAATAARAGRSVVLFEQASVPGGRARTRTERGFAFNIGPHALFRDGISLEVLRDLGVEPKAAKVGLAGAHVVKEGRLYELPGGLRGLVTSPLLDWQAKLEIGMFLGTVGTIDPRPLDGLTLEAWLRRALRTPGARNLVEVFIRTATYANDPSRLSAGAGLRQLRAALGGALYVHGGWQTIVDDLREQAREVGARIVSGARVAEVELAETAQAVQAVRLADGRRYEAEAAILAVPPRQASALVAGGRQATLASRAERAVPVRAASLDVGLRRLPRPNDWFAVGLDRPLYLSVHSNWARLAPEDGALIHVLRYLGPSPRGADDERELEGLLDLVQPGWRDEVETRRFVPELTVVGALPSVAWEQAEGPRGPSVPGAEGLFVAGDWVGPDGMLSDRALVSGARAGRAAADRPAPVGGAASARGAAPAGEGS